MPPLAQVLETLVDYLQDHAVKIITGLVLMVVGWYWGHRRARYDWQKQTFLDRLNISLNSIHNGQLLIRTLTEKHGQEIFLNSQAAAKVVEAARKTTPTDPLLPFSKDDYWYYLNAVLNELSEQFAVGHLRRDLGAPIQQARYLICLTCECHGELRTRKVRAMVVRKEVLTKLPAEAPAFASPHHSTRWSTLQMMAAEYAKHPWRFIEVELCA
ncbi:hypothetical protein GC163_04120 [bacterium]|nr:hypothetical protein [bacterium]